MALEALTLAAWATLSASAPAFTLDAAIARGLQANPRLAQALAIAERAEATATTTRSQWLPTATINAGLTQLDNNRVLGDRVLVPATSLNANLSIQLPLLALNRWLASGQAAEALKAEQLGAEDAKRLITGLVARAWYQVRLQTQLVEIAERAAQTSTRQLELASRRGEGGLGTQLDVVRAKRELKDNENRWAQARAELAASRETLGVVLGLETPAVTEGEPTIPALPSEDDAAALVRLRGDVAAAEARVAVARRRVDESWTDHVPTLVGGFTPFLQSPATPTQPNVGFTATIALTQPLYDGSARSGLRQDRVAALHAALGQRDETVQRALGDARAALAQAAARAQGAEAATASAELAAEALRMAQVSYQEGAGTSIELVDAERASRDAATNASVARAQAELARVDVLVACGVWGAK
ncbi:MAG: TolC family protein [Archangium sp.]|nr:TolC family protein [Archangium sp.]